MSIGIVGKHAAVALLVGLVVGAWQDRAHDHGASSALAWATCWMAVPLVGVASGAGSRIAGTVTAIIRAPHLERENRKLRAELARMRRESAEMAEVRAENRRLWTLLRLATVRAQQGDRTIAAQVIGREAGPWLRSLMINRGQADVLRAGQVVISSAGVVGQIESVASHSAVVAPITSRVGAASAIMQASRNLGVVIGDGTRGCLFQALNPSAQARSGELVLTSGLGKVYPKGLLLGAVARGGRDHKQPSTFPPSFRVEPAVDFGRLEEVLVIGSAQEGMR